MSKETLIADCETDGLLPEMTRLHCLQIGTAGGDDVTLYADDLSNVDMNDDRIVQFIIKNGPIRPIAEGLSRLQAATKYVFHNGIGFDLWAINMIHPGVIQREKMLDTLVMARLAFPEERSHSLAAWGQRTNTLKGDFHGPWDRLTTDMLAYAAQDIHAGRAVWNAVKMVLDWGTSCQLEHDTAWWMLQQERNGFQLDVLKATGLDVELRSEIAVLDDELQKVFPPIERSQEFIPKVNMPKLGYQKGVPFAKRWTEVFEPGSRKQIAERLQALGWKPAAFGDNGVPTVDEAVLAKLPYSGAKLLLKRFDLTKRLGQVSDGKQGWLRLVGRDGRVHGRVNPNGAVTGRMSHSRPNMAQVDKKDPRMRECWIPRDGWELTGCDAEGIEARMLAHYLAPYDNGELIDRIVSGTKEARTDTHSANLDGFIRFKLLPEQAWTTHFKVGRDGSKTLLYALMYGAGDFKLGETVKSIWRDIGLTPPRVPSRELGALARKAMSRSMRGSDVLVAKIKGAAKSRGYLLGLDGRHLHIRSEHAALNTLLQGGGAIVMKQALNGFCVAAEEYGHMGTNWALCANVHDEVQIECEPALSKALGQLFADSIRNAGTQLGVRCPLAGAYAIGKNWHETH